MRRALYAGLPLLCAVAAALPGSASADQIALSAVPAGKVPVAGDAASKPSAPDHVNATEKVDGFFPAQTPAVQLKRIQEQGGYRYVYVFGNEEQAHAYSAFGSTSSEGKPGGTGACFSIGTFRTSRLSFGTYVPATPKAGSLAAIAAAKKAQAAGPKKKPAAAPSSETKASPIRAIRSERFVPGADGKGALEIVEAWLDTETLGVRVASKTSLPFARVAAGPSGLEIYADRDDKEVNFFITPPKIPAQKNGETPAMLGFVANRMVAQLPSGNTSSSSSECGYMRVSLHAEAGSGQMASVLATAFLAPAPEDGEPVDKEPSFNDNNGDDDERRGDQTIRGVRTRPVIANLSVSQLASEADPLLSVSFAWAGHDQQQRF